MSGEGSNLSQVLHLEKIEALKHQKVVLVHSNRACPALEKAKAAQKPVHLQNFKEADAWARLLEVLSAHQVERIFLLGYLKILPPEFLEAWAKPIVNLHPSLLPKYKGLHAAQRAFDSGDLEGGVSLHEVVAELDSGQLISQIRFQRAEGEAWETYWKKIRESEKKIVEDYLLSLESSFQASLD